MAAQLDKRKEAQANEKQVMCNGKSLVNIYLFKYLGSIFAADGSQEQDVLRRCAMAVTRCGQLRNVFDSPDIPLKLKLNIYNSAVLSLLTYGCEAWSMTPKIQAKINGVNARCLSRITGRSIHIEASSRTQTLDVITDIRIRKWKWLGHLLRAPGDRLTKLALKVQFDKQDKLNMLQDIPRFCKTFKQLERLAQDRKAWRSHQPTRSSCNKPGVTKSPRKPKVHMTVRCSPQPRLVKKKKTKTPVPMKGQWRHFNMYQPPKRKAKKITKKWTYEQKLAEYNKTLPPLLPNIPSRTPQEEFERAHWHDLYFIGHKIPHHYGVPLYESGQDPATTAYIIDDTMTPEEENFYDRRARDEIKRKKNVAKLLKKNRHRFRSTRRALVDTTIDNNSDSTTTESDRHARDEIKRRENVARLLKKNRSRFRSKRSVCVFDEAGTNRDGTNNNNNGTNSNGTKNNDTNNNDTTTTTRPTINNDMPPTTTKTTLATTTPTTTITTSTTPNDKNTPTTTLTTNTITNDMQDSQHINKAMCAVFDSSDDEYTYSLSHDSNSHFSDYRDNTPTTFKPKINVHKLIPSRLRPCTSPRSARTPSKACSHTVSTPTPSLSLTPISPPIIVPDPLSDSNSIAPYSQAPNLGAIPISTPLNISPILPSPSNPTPFYMNDTYIRQSDVTFTLPLKLMNDTYVLNLNPY